MVSACEGEVEPRNAKSIEAAVLMRMDCVVLMASGDETGLFVLSCSAPASVYQEAVPKREAVCVDSACNGAKTLSASEQPARPARVFKAGGSTDPMWVLKSAEANPPRSSHRLDGPGGVFLSMVASPHCRFRFARQNHCSAAATSAANFRVRRQN